MKAKGIIEEVVKKPGQKTNGEAFIRYGIHLNDGKWYSTFNSVWGDERKVGEEIEFDYVDKAGTFNGKEVMYHNIVIPQSTGQKDQIITLLVEIRNLLRGDAPKPAEKITEKEFVKESVHDPAANQPKKPVETDKPDDSEINVEEIPF